MAKIYLWTVCEKVVDLLDKFSVDLVDDVEGGHVLKCGFCGKTYVVPTFPALGEEVKACPHCKGDIIYPRADW